MLQLSEVRIKLMHDQPGAKDRLLAFCSITFDDAFVVRDLRIIEGGRGHFVAMPSRKLTDRCRACGNKNALNARFCNHCGSRLDENRAPRDADGRAKMHADVAHPINAACRDLLQSQILAAYEQELELSRQPGYVSRYYDPDDELEASRAAAPLRRSSHRSPN